MMLRLDLGFDAKRISKRIKEYAKKAGNEEQLKIKVEGLIQEVIIRLIEHYGVAKGKKEDVEKLMFAVHTYYTLVMKLLTSEVITV